jgi:hypothetical protein
MMTWAFSFLFPFLLATALLQTVAALSGRNLSGWGPALVVGLIGAGIVLFPVGGLPLARWLISFNANFSIPLTAMLLARVIQTFSGIRLLDGKALLTGRIFSLAAGAALYPMALGLGRWDPYAAGWEFSWLFVLLFFFTVALLIMKNRFAVVLMAVILAYQLQLLESTNLWDYLVDPFLVFVSCIGLGGRLRRKARGARRKGMQN